jgi:hypothetical protein
MKERRVLRNGGQALALGAILVAAMVGVWWALPDGAVGAGVSSQPRVGVEAQPAAALTATAPATAQPDTAPRSTEEGAREDVAAALEVLVLDRDGQPIPAARVSWTQSFRGTSDLLAWGQDELEQLAQSGRRATTDGRGAAVFVAAPGDGERSVVWVTKPGFAPAARLFSSEAAPQRLELRLDRAVAIEVSVVTAAGEPAPSAQVYQLGVSRQEARRAGFLGRWESRQEEGALPADDVLQELARVGEADAEGRVAISAAAPVSLLIASLDGARSGLVPVTPDDSAIQLRLGNGMCSAGGSVAAGAEVGSPESYVVRVIWRQANSERLLGEATPGASGEWGPLELPVLESGHLQFSLHGDQGFAAPVKQEFPLAGEMLVVNFQVEAALTQEVFVRDEEQLPLEDVRVRLFWPEGEIWGHAEAWSDSRGVALVKGCKPTTVSLRARAKGFVPLSRDNQYLPAPDDIILVMERSGALSGRVTFEGEPISNFDIFFWREGRGEMTAESFSGREDGVFELAGVSTGALELSATAEGYAQSTPVLVAVGSEPGEPVELELLAGLVGKGRVVDATTSAPVVGARVQQLAHGLRGASLRRGDPILTDADGSFELRGMSVSEQVLVSADGYEMLPVNASADAHGVVDFGVVSLGGLSPLEVRVLEDGPFVYGKWWFGTLEGPKSIPLTPVQVDGSLTVEDVSPGLYMFYIVTQDGTTHTVDGELLPGDEWLVEFPVTGGKSLEVHTEIPPEFDLEPMLLLVEQELGGRLEIFTDRVSESGKQTVSALHGDRVSLLMMGQESGSFYAAEDVDLSGAGPYSAELIVEEIRFRVQVESDAELDLSSGMVGTSARSAVADRPWYVPCDEDGLATAYRPAGDEFVLMYLVRNRMLHVRPMTREESYEGTVELSLGRGRDVELEVLDGQQPVAGALWQLSPPCIRMAVMDGRCSEDGRSGARNLSDSTYRVTLSLPGYWTAEHEVTISSSGTIPLQLRRRGNLRLSLLDSSGAPSPGTGIGLRSLEFGVAVDEWLAEGRLSGETTRLVTDAAGVAEVVGVPHGEYEWTATLPSGETGRGVVVVPRGTWGAAELRLGD